MKTGLLTTNFSSGFASEKRADIKSSFCVDTKQQVIFPLEMHSYILPASQFHFICSHNRTLCDFKYVENVEILSFWIERSFA